MPRTGRGGSRQGTPGQNYANRTDLQQAKIPMQTATGQAYGVAGQQQAAMHQIPLAPPPPPGAGLPGQGQAAAQPAPTGPAPGPPSPLPGELGNFAGPTNRPDEHLMTGSPSGPGPGPEILTMNQRTGQLADQLDQMARQSGNSDLQILASRARSLGQ